MKDDNLVLGKNPELYNSDISFKGRGNVLFCEDNVSLIDSHITFCGDNSLIFIRGGSHKLNIEIYNDSVCFLGKYTGYTNPPFIIVSERKHVFIGDYCMFASNVTIRNSDSHLMYDCDSGKRINKAQSVFIGDHVWLGHNVYILKGTVIDSGSVIGANGVLANKKIPHNSVWGGNPAMEIKRNAFWDKTFVCEFDKTKESLSLDYEKFLDEFRKGCSADFWIYRYDKNEEVKWEYLDEVFSKEGVFMKCEFIKNLTTSKNRFVHKYEDNTDK